MDETEAKVIERTTTFADALEILWERNHKGPGTETGWPDHNFYFHDGHVFKIEFKRTGEEASPLQAHRIAALRERGYDVEVYDSSYEACKALAYRMGAYPPPGGSDDGPSGSGELSLLKRYSRTLG